MTHEAKIDFKGARGSNAGDEFHELWVARECLRLLEDRSQLTAIMVEGTRSSNKDYTWEGADCTLYFNGNTNSNAERVEIQQLKYSSANPDNSWTVARICSGKNRNPAKSLLRKLATAFKQLRDERKDRDIGSIKVSLITNQPIHNNLIKAIKSAQSEIPQNFSKAWKKCDSDLHRLVKAGGLSSVDFHEFAKVLELRGSNDSRFAIEDNLVTEVSRWNDFEFVEVIERLRSMVRKQMLPENAGDFINRSKVLATFEVSDEHAIFPCPMKIKNVNKGVERAVSINLAGLLEKGEQKICLHGGSGVGKTTVLTQLESCLLYGSVVVIFDCYGGGSYLDASALRHRPQEAFL